MSISFFNDLEGLFHILVDFHHSADHQKLNVIQKQGFHFLKIFFQSCGGGGGGGTSAGRSANFDSFSEIGY